MQNVLVRPQTTVAQPLGSLNASHVVRFQDQLHEVVVATNHARLLVDMGQVEAIDSAGLMALVHALHTAQRLNKRLTLCSVSRSVRMIFELTQLDRVFEIFEEPATLQELAA